MKATSIVRRVDDLGRVVIPKEIRRTRRIREGDPLEIFLGQGGEIIFKKYSPPSLQQQLDDLLDDIARRRYDTPNREVSAMMEDIYTQVRALRADVVAADDRYDSNH